MVNDKLLKLILSILGNYLNVNSKGDYTFYCPHCNHHKPKLNINLLSLSPNFQYYNCWVCLYKGKQLYNLIKLLAPEYLLQFNLIVKQNKPLIFNNNYSNNIKSKYVSLPKLAKPLYIKNLNSPLYRNAMYYLLNRLITITDIRKYNLHYCFLGRYLNRIIFPSYNITGQLNFFTARSYNNNKIKYLMPPVDKLLIFNLILISWKYPIYICLGVMDAIAIGDNAIPIMGKFVNNYLLTAILNNKPPKIYIVLDNDAYKDALIMALNLTKLGIPVYVTQLPNNKDPGLLGYNKVHNYINNSKVFNKQFKINNMFKR